MNGCFEITFSDCDDSITNDRTDNHGYYDIKVNDTIIAYGGYYATSESHIVCTNNNNQVGYCIAPQFCQNNDNLGGEWISGSTNVEFSSYQSVINSFIDGIETGIDVEFLCTGDQSCIYSTFSVSIISAMITTYNFSHSLFVRKKFNLTSNFVNLVNVGRCMHRIYKHLLIVPVHIHVLAQILKKSGGLLVMLIAWLLEVVMAYTLQSKTYCELQCMLCNYIKIKPFFFLLFLSVNLAMFFNTLIYNIYHTNININ